jgi:hypothetical protein
MPDLLRAASLESMPCYLVEIVLPQSDAAAARRASRTIRTAQSRLDANGTVVRALIAGFTEDGRLVCLMEAATSGDARSLVALALLPAGRIHEVVDVALQDASRGSGFDGRRPGFDLRSGADPELVEDVVDMGLDGSLRDE